MAWSGLGIRVRRYFFHLANGVVHEDDEGVELADLEAAKRTAVQLIAETLFDQPGRFWSTESYQVTCTDEDGLTLFSIQMVATLSPASGAG